jgi:hypothetical protein
MALYARFSNQHWTAVIRDPGWGPHQAVLPVVIVMLSQTNSLFELCDMGFHCQWTMRHCYRTLAFWLMTLQCWLPQCMLAFALQLDSHVNKNLYLRPLHVDHGLQSMLSELLYLMHAWLAGVATQLRKGFVQLECVPPLMMITYRMRLHWCPCFRDLQDGSFDWGTSHTTAV